MVKITPGFLEGGNFNREPFGGQTGAGDPNPTPPPPDLFPEDTCFELGLVHIDFNVGYEQEDRGWRGKVWKETGKWSSTGLTVVSFANLLSAGKLRGIGLGQILKECTCLNKTALLAGRAFAPLILLDIPFGGQWTTQDSIVRRLKKSKGVVERILGKSEEIPEFIFNKVLKKKAPKKWIQDNSLDRWWEDQYIEVYYKEVCKCRTSSTPPSAKTCKCSGSVSVRIDIDETTKQYKTSNGNIITFDDETVGNRRKVIREIMAAEKAIPLSCGQ